MSRLLKCLFLLFLILSSCNENEKPEPILNQILIESEENLPRSPKELGNNITRKEIRLQLKQDIEGLDDEVLKVDKIIQLIEYLQTGSRDVFHYIAIGLELAKKNNLKNQTGVLYYELAWYYFSQNIKENTITSFEESLKYLTDKELIVYTYCVLSNNSSWDDDHEKALEYAIAAYEVARNSGLPQLEAEALMTMGDVYRFQDKMNVASRYYMKTVNLLYFQDDNKIISPLYLLSAVYTGNTARMAPFTSFYYAFQLKDTYDNLTFYERQMFVFNLIKASDASIFNTNVLETKIAQLAISGLLIISLLVIAVLLILQSIRKRKINKKLEKANEVKAQLLLIQNHDLRKPLASLVSFLELKKYNPNISKEELDLIDEKVLDLTSQTLKNMDDLIIWSKDQMKSFEPHDTSISVSAVFEEIKDIFAYEKEVNVSYDIPKDLQMKVDDNYLKTIIRNLTQNAIAVSKRSESKEVLWQVRKEHKRLIFSVQNSGEKMKDESINTLLSEDKGKVTSHGAGLIIIRDLAKALKCKIEVKTSDAFGTTISLVF